MVDWLLRHSFEITALSSVVMAAATIVMAAATSVYALIANKTLKQLKQSTSVAVLPSLALVEDTFGASFPQVIGIDIKNTGFGPAVGIQPEMGGARSELGININKRNLTAGDTLRLKITAEPIGFSPIGSDPIFKDELEKFSGLLTVHLSYRGILGDVFGLMFAFSVDSGRVTLVHEN